VVGALSPLITFVRYLFYNLDSKSHMAFRNKRVWITGASSGIGEALAYEMAQEGAHLILSARRTEELERVMEGCQAAASVQIVPLDLSKHDQIAQIVQEVLSEQGKIDVLINNGGISQRALALDTTLDVDRKLMEVNYFGTVALTKALIPSMITHQLGHIVTITSLTAKFGTKLRSSYAASKHALHGFFDSLRAELGDTPIKITLVCPGFVRTHISENALTGKGTKQGTMDDATNQGMLPGVLARKILQAVAAEREEVYFGGKEVYAVYLKRFFPKVLSRMMRKAKVT
jgi:dehydrogenase/reductase SDR family member 7B